MLALIKEKLKFSADICLASIFWALLIWRSWSSLYNFELAEIKNGIIGLSSYYGFSVDRRVHFFYLSVLIILIFVFVFYLLLALIKTRIQNSLKYLNVISIIGLVQLAFLLFNPSEDQTIGVIVNIMACAIVYSCFEFFGKDIYHRENSFLILVFGVAFAVQIIVFDLLHIYKPSHFLVISIFLIICGWFVKNRLRMRYSRLLFASIPILLIPILHFLIHEIYLALNQHCIFIRPKLFYCLAIMALVSWGIVRIFDKKKINTSRLISNFLLPILLINLVLLAYYKPVIAQSTELFELANPANAIMRFLKFGEIPFLEFMNSHLISDFLPGFLYVFVNGYSVTSSFQIYSFLVIVIFLVIVYFFFSKLFQNGYYAFLIILFLPIAAIFMPTSIAPASVTIILLYKLFSGQNFKNIFRLFVWLTILVFWSLDIATANILVSLIFVAALFAIFKEKKPLIFNFLKAFALYVALLGLVFLICYLIEGNALLVNIHQSLSYFSANQAHGLPILTYNADRLYYIHYFIVPVLLIVSLVYLVIRYSEFKQKNFFLYFTILFLIAYTFASARRGLIRHSMAEGCSELNMVGFFYIIVPLFILLHLQSPKWKFIWFISVSCLLTIVLKYPSPNDLSNLYIDFRKGISEFPEIHYQHNKIARATGVDEFANANYSHLKTFMDTNFTHEATFLDFSNTPMLYFYLERKVPSYFNQSLQSLTTEYLQEENIKRLKKLDIPIVIFSNSPENWGDNTDGVPNTLRYYRIADYIFTNYRPFSILDKHQVWCRNEVAIKDSGNYLPIDTSLLYVSKTEQLQKLPYLLAKSWFDRPSETICSSNATEISSITIIDRHDNYVDVEIENNSASNTVANLQYFQQEKVRGTFIFDVLPGYNHYLLPLSMHYNWVKLKCNKLRVTIDNNKQAFTKRVKIIKIKFDS